MRENKIHRLLRFAAAAQMVNDNARAERLYGQSLREAQQLEPDGPLVGYVCWCFGAFYGSIGDTMTEQRMIGRVRRIVLSRCRFKNLE